MASPSSDISRRNTSIFLASGANTTSGVDFVVNLQNPILIDGRTEVCLAALTLDYEQQITIVGGANNRIDFQLAVPNTGAVTYSAFLEEGTYDPPGLAAAVQRALNATGPGDPLNNQFGSFRCSWNQTSLRFKIEYLLAGSSKAVAASDVTLTEATYVATGGFERAAGAAGPAFCTIKKPLATNVGRAWCGVPQDTNFSVAVLNNASPTWDPTLPPGAAGSSICSVDFNSTAQEFTVTVRGVAGTAIPAALRPAAVPPAPQPPLEDIVFLVMKLGNTVYFGYRLATAATGDAFEELARVPLLDSDTVDELVTPQLYVSFMTIDDAKVISSVTPVTDPYFTGVTLEIGGVLYDLPDARELAQHDIVVHALLYGRLTNPPAEISQVPPGPGGGRSLTISFPTGTSPADIMGFPTAAILKQGGPYSWESPNVPIFSIDTGGMQSSLYVTSNALNVGSRFQSPGTSSNPFILGSVPVVAHYFAQETHVESNISDPFYNTLVLGDKQVLSTIDIQIRDSKLVTLQLPTTGGPNRSTLELRFRNHPVA
jgi:hypothetical protein